MEEVGRNLLYRAIGSEYEFHIEKSGDLDLVGKIQFIRDYILTNKIGQLKSIVFSKGKIIIYSAKFAMFGVTSNIITDVSEEQLDEIITEILKHGITLSDGKGTTLIDGTIFNKSPTTSISKSFMGDDDKSKH